jgi:hypothetical protein
MLAWFTSLNGAITLSIFAFLTMMARITFLDAMFVPEFRNMLPEDRPAGIGLMMLVYTVFVGGWVWSLLATARSSRTGLIVSLIYCLFVALGGGLLTLLVFCPAGCAAWPVGNLIVWGNLISGLAASFALGIQFRQTPGQRKSLHSTMSGETV